MTWTIDVQRIGLPPISATAATAAVPVGTVVPASHETYGGGEFVYLLGAASTAVGDVVTYSGGSTTRLAASTAVGPVAVAMSANVAGQYGWYAISGCVPTNTAGAVALGAPAYAAATGKVDDAVVAGEVISGMWFAETTAGAGSAIAQLQRPSIA